MRGNGRVFQRGSIWWVAYDCNGREYRESSKSRERKDAVRLLRQRIGEVAAGTVPHQLLPTRTVTRVVMMQDLFDLVEQEYQLKNRTSPANGSILRRLRQCFAGYTVDACTGLVITHYMAARQRAGRKPETINREMNVLRRAFSLGYQHDLVSRKPSIQRLPELGVCNEFFTREEVNLLLPHLPEYLRDVVLFGFLTGWRKGEIVGLQWNNVDRSGAVVRMEPAQNKGRDVRVLVLQGELAALIERRWQSRKIGRALALHVFHRNGHQLKNFYEVWLKACHQSGLGHRRFHSLRRGAARCMALEGIPEKVMMSLSRATSRAPCSTATTS